MSNERKPQAMPAMPNVRKADGWTAFRRSVSNMVGITILGITGTALYDAGSASNTNVIAAIVIGIVLGYWLRGRA